MDLNLSTLELKDKQIVSSVPWDQTQGQTHVTRVHFNQGLTNVMGLTTTNFCTEHIQ